MTQDKEYEKRYHDKWIELYSFYQVYPDSEYKRILEELKIFNEKKNSLLLDIGCGSGAFSEKLGSVFKVVGIDISEEMIGVAKQNTHKNIEYIVADTEKLPFENDSFDIVFVAGTLHHCVSILSKVINEISRVTKSGGKIFIMEPHSRNPENFYGFHFSEEPTKNERGINPKRLKRMFKRSNVYQICFKDIGFIKKVHIDNYKIPVIQERSLFNKIISRFFLFCLVSLQKTNLIKYFPGIYFIMMMEKK